MSRSKPDDHMSSPVDFKLEWVGHGEGGYYEVWDKETKQTIKLELPLRFAFLDSKRCVAGYYEAVHRGFFSNEVRNTKTQAFDVKYYKDGKVHSVANGVWSDIKGEIGNKGAKFCNMVYATLLSSTSPDIPGGSLVRIPFTGAAGSEWIDLKVRDGESFEVVKYEDRKKGCTAYRAPIMEKITISDDENAIACDQDAALQIYFDSKKEDKKLEAPDDRPPISDADAPAEPELAPDPDEAPIPF